MREIAHQLRHRAKRISRGFALQRGLSRLEAALTRGRDPTEPVLKQLIHGWGNESWSADPAMLTAMVKWMGRTRGPMLECGSGLSTLVLATAAAATGRHVTTLEHDASWAGRIREKLARHLQPRISIEVGPLRNYGEFDWYSVTEMPPSIGYIVCDGPPGTTRGGRYGLAPVLAGRLAADCVILLDDTQRREERQIIGRWCAELGATVLEEGATFTVIGRTGKQRGGVGSTVAESAESSNAADDQIQDKDHISDDGYRNGI